MSDNTALAAPEGGEPSIMQVISAVAQNPNIPVDRMRELIELRERSIAWEAEREFKAAFARLQPKLPRIVKKGMIVVPGRDGKSGHQTPFARYEDISEVVRPLLASEGFAVSYSFEGGVCHCTLSHKDGHSKVSSSPPMPSDTTGSKNSVQAVGSMMAYAKRYALCNILDIVTVGQDDDGAGAHPITQDEADELYRLMDAAELDDTRRARFLDKIAGAPTVAEIQRNKYAACLEALRKAAKSK